MIEKLQRSMHSWAVAALLLGASVSVGCTWVPLTPEGEAVKMGSAEEVESCEKVGTSTGTVLNKILFVRRSREKVGDELEAKARNEAAKMGGDTVVVAGKEVDASQTFDIYRCGS